MPGWVRSPRLLAVVAAVVLAGAAGVAFLAPRREGPGRQVAGRVVGGDEILRGPDLLLVEVPDEAGPPRRLRVRADDLLPRGAEVRLRIAPDGSARLSGPDLGRNPPPPAQRAAVYVAIVAALVLGTALLLQAAQRHEKASAAQGDRHSSD